MGWFAKRTTHQSKDPYPFERCGTTGILRLLKTTVINGRQGDELNFQVNEQTYFLDLEEDASKWVVFVETPTGTRQVPVYEDAPPFEDVKLVIEQRDKHKIVN